MPNPTFAAASDLALTWRVHLVRRDPGRLVGVAGVLLLGCLLTWAMYGRLLPVMLAALLLLGAVSEYLFPVTYRVTGDGVSADRPGCRLVLPWSLARRCELERRSMKVSPLARPSRLDAFRGVELRFAPDGQAGDRASVLHAIAQLAPNLLKEPPGAAL